MPVGLLLRKQCHNNKHFAELAPHHGGNTAGIDTVWRNTPLIPYVLCITRDGYLVGNNRSYVRTRNNNCSFLDRRIIIFKPLSHCRLAKHPPPKIIGSVHQDALRQPAWTVVKSVVNRRNVFADVIFPVTFRQMLHRGWKDKIPTCCHSEKVEQLHRTQNTKKR